MLGPWQMSFINIMKICDVNDMAGGSLSNICVYLFQGMRVLYSNDAMIIKDLILVYMANPTYG